VYKYSSGMMKYLIIEFFISSFVGAYLLYQGLIILVGIFRPFPEIRRANALLLFHVAEWLIIGR